MREQLADLMGAAYVRGADDGYKAGLQDAAAVIRGEVENASNWRQATTQLVLVRVPERVEEILQRVGI